MTDKTNQITFRTIKDKNWKTIKLDALYDKELSWKAKGLHTYLVSRPDTWTIRKNDLLNKSTDGSDSMYNGIKELKANGYIYNVMVKDAKTGKIINSIYLILETKIIDIKTVQKLINEEMKEDKEKRYDVIKYIPKPKPPSKRGFKKENNDNPPILGTPHDGLNPIQDDPTLNILGFISNQEKESIKESSKEDIDDSKNESSNPEDLKQTKTIPPINKPNPSQFSSEKEKIQVHSPDKKPSQQSVKFPSTDNNNKQNNGKLDESIDVSPLNKYIKYWNEKGIRPMSKHKDPSAKVYKDAVRFLNQLENGSFFHIHEEKILSGKMPEQNKDINFKRLKHRKFSEKEIFQAIDRLVLSQSPGYVTGSLPKSMVSWLWNETTGHSWALINLLKEPKKIEAKLELPKDPKLLEEYESIILSASRLHQLNDTALKFITKGLNRFLEKKRLYEQNYAKYIDLPYSHEEDMLIKKHKEFLKDRIKESKNQPYIPEDFWWNDFSVYLINKHGSGYNLNPTPKMIEQAKANYAKKQAELAEAQAKEEKIQEQIKKSEERAKNRPLNRFQMIAAAGR